MTMYSKTGLVAAICLLIAGTGIARSADPTHGATNFVFEPEGQLWHIVGPAKAITTWNGPFDVVARFRWRIYVTTWKQPVSASDAAQLLPQDLRVVHELGTTFYYPKVAKQPPLDPAQLGYTEEGFKRADQIASEFRWFKCGKPDGQCRAYRTEIGEPIAEVEKLFPEGLLTSGCHTSDGSSVFYIRGKSSQDVYLIVWGPDYVDDGSTWSADVVYMPAKLLTGSYASVLSNVAYYSNGGMWEIMKFGSYLYYLSRLPPATTIDVSTTAALCPATPKSTPTGLVVPKGWTEALRKLEKSN